MIKSIVAGNWKMNKTPKNGKQFISEVMANVDEIINVVMATTAPIVNVPRRDFV